MKKRLSQIRKAFRGNSYSEIENLVREATSNNNDLASPALVGEISHAVLQKQNYNDMFNTLWRRLCDRAHPRHVLKALLLLDHLIRVKPPNPALQFDLILDVLDRYADLEKLLLSHVPVAGGDPNMEFVFELTKRICSFIHDFQKRTGFHTKAEVARKQRLDELSDPSMGTKLLEEGSGEASGFLRNSEGRLSHTPGEKPAAADEDGEASRTLQSMGIGAGMNSTPVLRQLSASTVSSQPDVAPREMHRSLSTPSKPASAGWECKGCKTVSKNPPLLSCEICGRQRTLPLNSNGTEHADDLKRSPASGQSGETSSPFIKSRCLNPQEAPHNDPTLSATLKRRGQEQDEQFWWPCDHCNYVNTKWMDACEKCGKIYRLSLAGYSIKHASADFTR